jgi:hypothetical protein
VTLSTLLLRYAGANYQKANFLDGKGVKTPIFMRFSTVTLGREFPDLARNPRGFAIKFYTGEGNYDIVGLNFVSRTIHEQWHLYNNVIASLLLPRSYPGSGCDSLTITKPEELLAGLQLPF